MMTNEANETHGVLWFFGFVVFFSVKIGNTSP